MLQFKEKDFESFFNVPFSIRGRNSFYASPFKPDLKKILSAENPIFKTENDYTYYTVFKNNLPAGRITAHFHKTFNEKFNQRKCYFGYFECINDQEVANYLFNLAEKWARDRGFESIAGNFNLTAMQEMGIMTDGFGKEPYIAQSYGEPYYPELLKNAGYNPTFPMSTFEIDLQTIEPEIVLGEKQKQIFSDSDYEFIPITRSLYNKIRPVILDIFNKGFDQNPLFVPVSQKEFDFQAKDLVYFLDSHIAFLVKFQKKPIAVSTHIPDINPFLRATRSKLKITTLYHFLKCLFNKDRTLCIFASVLPEYQNKGIVGAISYLTLKAMKKRGYKKLGITWIADGNIGSLKKMKNLNAKKLHELKIFEKQLN